LPTWRTRRKCAEEVNGTGKENMGFADTIEFVHRDKDGKVIKKWTSKGTSHNCLTNLGFADVAALILLDVADPTQYDYIAIGTGTAAPNPTDTTLGIEKSRLAGVGTRVQTAVANDTAQLVATFSQAADGGLTGTDDITEVGVFNAATAGTMLMRQTFAAETLNWDAGDTLEMTVKIQVKQASA